MRIKFLAAGILAIVLSLFGSISAARTIETHAGPDERVRDRLIKASGQIGDETDRKAKPIRERFAQWYNWSNWSNWNNWGNY
ncbi:hypothetical protein [Chachezhania antarctica]|uniref:hypothetical protein n=1 Tax=Chachezhania antarctica TaxID=2340860 RepID=UPI0013CE63F2|nr:hypothetical protein [Chachezhania antarctica]|tara:strand:- start:4052 stop:4297 length:246 start_codon:yes stop_codon:yes gene_type:complete